MKKTRYIKPEVIVVSVSSSYLLLTTSQEIKEGPINVNDEIFIDSDDDFI